MAAGAAQFGTKALRIEKTVCLGGDESEKTEGPGSKPGAGILERETGFEPATSTLARSHSTTELFPPVGGSGIIHGSPVLVKSTVVSEFRHYTAKLAVPP